MLNDGRGHRKAKTLKRPLPVRDSFQVSVCESVRYFDARNYCAPQRWRYRRGRSPIYLVKERVLQFRVPLPPVSRRRPSRHPPGCMGKRMALPRRRPLRRSQWRLAPVSIGWGSPCRPFVRQWFPAKRDAAAPDQHGRQARGPEGLRPRARPGCAGRQDDRAARNPRGSEQP